LANLCKKGFVRYYIDAFVGQVCAATLTLDVFCKIFAGGIPQKFSSIIYLIARSSHQF
jgi:hypothetical protein